MCLKEKATFFFDKVGDTQDSRPNTPIKWQRSMATVRSF